MTKEDFRKLKIIYPCEVFIPVNDGFVVVIYKGKKNKKNDEIATQFVLKKYNEGLLKQSKYGDMFVFTDSDLCRELAASRKYGCRIDMLNFTQ